MSAGATGRCPRCSGQGGQESRVRMRGVRAETEQETGITASKGGRGRGGGTWSEVFKESLLCFAINRQSDCIFFVGEGRGNDKGRYK